jgi:hypothetical protein
LHYFRPRPLSPLIALLVLLSAPLKLQAEETLPDVRLLIDVSGSMRDSDPNNLREPALELMLRLLPDGSRAGVWTFGRWVNMPVAHGEVNEEWREQASRTVAEINNHGLLTNIPEALERATYDDNRLDYRFKTSIILLTDGKVEVSEDQARNERAARDVLERLAIEMRDTGIEVHTIALSDNADHDFLRRLAQLTGGLAEKAESADELSAVFLQALDIAAPTEQVPMLGGEFLIDDSVEEFTALVFPEAEGGAVTLIDPGQNQHTVAKRPDSVRWFQHQRFQLITVVNPQAGEWRIAAPGSIARVNIISHLSVALDGPPTSLEAGHSPELGIRLMDAADVIRDPDLLGLVNISARVNSGDNEQWEIQVPTAQVPDSGEYRIALPMLAQPGRYEIVVNIDGGGFQREQALVTDVFEPQPEPEVLPPAQEEPLLPAAWLLPTAVPVLLLVALAIWWFQRRDSRRDGEREDEWEDDDFNDGLDDDFDDDDEVGRGMSYDNDDELDEDFDDEFYREDDDPDDDFEEDRYDDYDDRLDQEEDDVEPEDFEDEYEEGDDDLPTGIRNIDPERRD